jgi:hypothetical protein
MILANWLRRALTLSAAATCLSGAAAYAYGDPTDLHAFYGELIPGQPSAADSIRVEITADAYGTLCGRALTLAPVHPDAPDIDLFSVSVTPNAGCPAVVWPVTLSFLIGRLSPGHHTVWVRTLPEGEWAPEAVLEFDVAAAPLDHLLLQGGRFDVSVHWHDFTGGEGPGLVVPGASADSGLFSFFSPSNWELLLKILDGCALNGHYWILGSGATTVQFSVEVRDTETDEVWRYDNPSGHPAGTFTDTSFAPCH